ncbi:Flp pilus assembly protein CpaB, partial [Stenotrophomonas sp. HMWF023]
MLKLTRIAAIALIALAVLLAVVAFVIGRKPAASADNPNTIVKADAQTFSVVEAIARLPAGEPISANGVRLTQRTAEVPGAVTDLAAVVGKVPVQDISEGSAIGASLLAQGFSLQLRPGERALAVPVDELVAAGNRILPGDFVDVFLNLRSAATSYNGQQDIAQTRLLLSRLRVLSYGQQDIAVAPSTAQGEAPATASNDSRAADITNGSSSTHSNGNGSDATQPARTAVLAVP